MKQLLILVLIIVSFLACKDEKKIETDRINNDIKYITIQDNPELKTKYKGQLTIEELEKLSGTVTYKDNPELKTKYTNLLNVEERLPSDPLVLIPLNKIGSYGGQLRGTSFNKLSGAGEIISWRQSNLVRLDRDLKTIVPDIAFDWEWNLDKTELIIYLRRNHRWSDGEKFTADDIIFWWNDIVLYKELNKYFPYEWTISDRKSLSGEELVEHVPMVFKSDGVPLIIKKISDISISIRGQAPIPNFLYVLADMKIKPFAPKHFLKKYHLKYNSQANEDAIKAGFSGWEERFFSFFRLTWNGTITEAYVPTLDSHCLTKYVEHKYRQFTANPYYHVIDTAGNQLPYITEHLEYFSYNMDEINKMISDGSIDMKTQSLNIDDIPKNISLNNNVLIYYDGGATQSIMYAFNCSHKDPMMRRIYNDYNFRLAMSLGINRSEIIETIYNGNAVLQQAGPEMQSPYMGPLLSNTSIEYNPEKSNILLDNIGLIRDESGWRMTPDGKPFVIIYQYSQQGGSRKIHYLVKKYWENLGIRIILQEITIEQLRIIYEKNQHDLAVWQSELFWELELISRPETFIPPYYNSTPLFGIPWVNWYNSSGISGFEPPIEVKELYKIYWNAKKNRAGTEEYFEIYKKMSEINLKNLWLIGTAGQTQRVLIKSKKINNFPLQIKTFLNTTMMMSYYPAQWFFDKT